MSRSGYNGDDCDQNMIAMWRGQVASAIRGKRGQTFLRDLVEALDAMPNKRLIADHLRAPTGEVCAMGALGLKRGIDMNHIDADDTRTLGQLFNIAHQLAAEVAFYNDEYNDCRWVGNKLFEITPEERWINMRAWAVSRLEIEAVDVAPVAST